MLATSGVTTTVSAGDVFPTMLVVLTIASAVFGIAFLVLPFFLQRAWPVRTSGAALTDEKTRLDIEDLRFGWMRTLGTAVLTAAIAVGGWYVQQRAAADDLKNKEQIAADDRRQRDDQSARETLSRYLGDLGDANVTKRVAAASYLAQVYPATTGVQTAQILDVLTSRITAERDRGVVDFLSTRIIELSHAKDNRRPLLEAAADANRRAAFAYARDLGLSVGQTFFDETTPGERSIVPEIGNMFSPWPDGDEHIKRIVRRFTAFTSFGSIVLDLPGRADSFYQFKSDPTQNFAGVFRRSLQIAANGSAKTRRRTDDDVADDAFALKNTGALLSAMLRDLPNNADGLDLRATFFPFTDLSEAHLMGADLRNAVIAGSLGGAQLDFANLEGASLVFARQGTTSKRRTSIRAANLKNTVFLSHTIFLSFQPWTQGSNRYDAIEWAPGVFGGPLIDERRQSNVDKNVAKHAYAQCQALAATAKRTCPWQPSP